MRFRAEGNDDRQPRPTDVAGVRLLLTVGIIFAAAWAALALFIRDNGFAPVWFANAVLLAILLRAAPGRRVAFTVAGAIGLTLGNLAAADPPLIGVALAGINVGEVVGAWMLLRLAAIDRPDPSDFHQLLMFVVLAGVVAPAGAAVVAATFLGLTQGVDAVQVAARWFPADSLGMLMFAPLLLAVRRDNVLGKGSSLDRLRSMAILAVTVLLATALFSATTLPLAFLILPWLTFCAFYLRFVGVAGTVVAVAIPVTILTVGGQGPFAFFGDPRERLLLLQLFLVVVTLSTLPLSAVLTERRRFASALSESGRRYRRLTDAAPAGIFQVGWDGRTIYVNEEWVRLTGYPADRARGEGWMGAVAPEERPAVEAAWAFARGTAAPFRRDIMFLDSRGERRLFNVTATADRDPDGGISGWVGLVVDIHDARQAEKAAAAAAAQMRETHRLLTMAEATARMGHWRLDMTTRTIHWSAEACRIHDFDADRRPTLDSTVEAYHPDDREMIRTRVAATIETGEPFTYTARLLTAVGDTRYVTVQGQGERGADGGIKGVFGVIQDVSAQTAVRAELIAARDAANEAARVKADFLAMMSHEIRTPMTGVLGTIELLRAATTPADQDRYFATLKQSARLLMSVLDDALDYAKIENDKLLLEDVRFDLREVAQTCVDLFHDSAERKRLALSLSMPDGADFAVRGDPARLTQILSNLVSNAIKFTARGEIAIAVAVAAEGAGVRRWRIEVRDTGIGVARDTLEQLFSPFVQADASTTRRFGGTGLGLAISRRLVEAMGGEIGVVSEADQGSTFWLEVPFPLVTDDGEDSDADGAEAAAARPLKILLAEDNEVSRLLVAGLLERMGHSVVGVANGEHAVDEVALTPFDVVLMDMQMPVLDGLAATRAIRALGGAAAGTPVLALTADASPERRHFYENCGLDGFLTKPIDAAVLAREMNRVTAGMAAAPTTAAAVAPPAGDQLFDEGKLQVVAKLLGPEQRDRLLRMLRDDAVLRAADVRRIVGAGDITAAQRSAHALRGAASNLGAAALVAAASEVEHAGTGAIDAASAHLEVVAVAVAAEIDRRLAG